MNYEAAVRYLLSLGRELAAPTQASTAKFDLENITVLAERLGRPDRAYPSVHIAGTNGKGSTAAFLESILRVAGFRSGLYTSPHLSRMNERIRIAGEEIPDDTFANIFSRIHELIERLLAEGKLRAHPTFFECVTALAFEAFAQARVDFSVIEVGLGGRLDATNIVRPTVAVITRVAFDHENFLGHSLREIAAEKAGILKPAIPAILAPQEPEALDVILERGRETGAPILQTEEQFRTERVWTEEQRVRAEVVDTKTGTRIHVAPGLRGQFQLQNARNALAAARFLASRGFRIPDHAIEQGIERAEWPGRLEHLGCGPDVYLDGAHNPSAAREVAEFLGKELAGRRIRILFGALRDKAVDEIAGILFPQAEEVVFTDAGTSRAISPAQLAEIAGHHAKHYALDASPHHAFETLLAGSAPSDAVFVTGSLYLVGRMREYWKNRVKVAAQ